MNAFVQLSPSPAWANKIVGPYKGLPFHDYLHASPPRRQRTLTGPVDPAQGSLWHRFQVFAAVEPEQQFSEQAQSRLLSQLPLDIRMIIYEMVLGGMIFHLNAQDRRSRILHHVCAHPETINDPTHQCHELSTKRPSSNPREEYREATGLLPLLVTCRLVYSEAIETLYRANTFEFTQNFAAFRFLRLLIPPQRLHDISHFRMRMRVPHHPTINSRSRRDWTDLFSFFSTEMNGLQSLFLVLDPNQPMKAHILETADHEGVEWVKPMVLMAVDANRKRACKVEIVTEGVIHVLNKIFKETASENTTASYDHILEMACTTVHKRIRLSLSAHG